MLSQIKAYFKRSLNYFRPHHKNNTSPLAPESKHFLNTHVSFYQQLSEEDKRLFERRVQLFLSTTDIVAYGPITVEEADRLLIAASAIIPVWAFPKWHYFNLKRVILLPGAFNADFHTGENDSTILGMVGTGPLQDKMILSKPALHHGFANDRDKRNVGIHEFAHLIDMADGDCDGFPERLKEHAYSIPWFELVRHKMNAIRSRESNICNYGSTNQLEFFAVATEYFFERPKMMKRKHPELYDALVNFYKQDLADIAEDIQPRKNSACPCGSGKKYKRCCLPID